MSTTSVSSSSSSSTYCSFSCGGGGGGGSSTTTTTTGTQTVGTTGAITQAWLDQANVTWKPSSNTSIGWTGFLQAASYNNLFTTTQSNIMADINMLVSTGVSCIRIDIGYDSWLLNNATAKTEVTTIVNQIRADGKCLIIADAGAESYRNNKQSWASFRTEWIARDRDLAGLYKPDFYETIKEPGWYNGMVLVPSQNVAEWNTLDINLINAVQSNSSNSLIGIAAPGNQLNVTWIEGIYANATTLSGIDFLGVDNYAIGDFNHVITYFASNPTTKHLWVAEAGSTVSTPTNSSAQIALDPNWIQTVYYYALYMGVTNVIPFWSNTLASYNTPVDYTQRTPWYTTFTHLANVYGTFVT